MAVLVLPRAFYLSRSCGAGTLLLPFVFRFNWDVGDHLWDGAETTTAGTWQLLWCRWDLGRLGYGCRLNCFHGTPNKVLILGKEANKL